VGVGDIDDLDGGDVSPIKPAIGFSRHGIVGGNEQETPRVLQIDGELSFEVSGEFMAPRRWCARDLRQTLGGLKLQQALHQPLRPGRAVGENGLLLRRAGLLKLLVSESYLHARG